MNFKECQHLELVIHGIVRRDKLEKKYSILWKDSEGKLFTATTYRTFNGEPMFQKVGSTQVTPEFLGTDNGWVVIAKIIDKVFPVDDFIGTVAPDLYNNHPEMFLSKLIAPVKNLNDADIKFESPSFFDVSFFESEKKLAFYVPTRDEQFQPVSLLPIQ